MNLKDKLRTAKALLKTAGDLFSENVSNEQLLEEFKNLSEQSGLKLELAEKGGLDMEAGHHTLKGMQDHFGQLLKMMNRAQGNK